MKNKRGFLLTLLTFFTAFTFCACSQTVSNSNNDEEDTDNTENITAPPLNKVTVSDDGSSEAKSFFDGQEKIEFLSQYKLHGSDSLKELQRQEMNDSLKKGQQFFDSAAKSEKWFVPATIQKGSLYFAMANIIKEQESNATSEVDSITDVIFIALELPTYYEQARAIFQQGIDSVRSKKINDSNTQILEEYYIYTFYESCSTYRETSILYLNAPLPDSAAVADEYIRYEGATIEDAIEMTHEDLDAYREALSKTSKEKKEKAVSVCNEGIKAAQEYNLNNDQVKALESLLHLLTY